LTTGEDHPLCGKIVQLPYVTVANNFNANMLEGFMPLVLKWMKTFIYQQGKEAPI